VTAALGPDLIEQLLGDQVDGWASPS